MSTVQFEHLGSEIFEGQRPRKPKSTAAKVIEFGNALGGAESSAPLPHQCFRCLSHRNPKTSTAQYSNVFCSEECEQEFVRAALAALTVEDCMRIHVRLEALLVGSEQPAFRL